MAEVYPPAPVAIYGLYEPGGGTLRYVGKSVDPVARHYRHCKGDEPTHAGRWIRKLRADGLAPQLCILAWVSEEEWPDAEIHFIALARRIGCLLTNTHDGGGGGNPGIYNRGRTLTEEHRERIRRSNTGKTMLPESIAKGVAKRTGQKRTDEQRARMSAAHVGKPQSPEAVEKRAASNRGKKRTPEQVAAQADRLRGKKRTPEQCARFSAAQRRRFM